MGSGFPDRGRPREMGAGVATGVGVTIGRLLSLVSPARAAAVELLGGVPASELVEIGQSTVSTSKSGPVLADHLADDAHDYAGTGRIPCVHRLSRRLTVC